MKQDLTNSGGLLLELQRRAFEEQVAISEAYGNLLLFIVSEHGMSCFRYKKTKTRNAMDDTWFQG